MASKKGKPGTRSGGLPQGVSALSKRFGEPKIEQQSVFQNYGREFFIRSAANVFGWLVQQWIRHTELVQTFLGAILKVCTARYLPAGLYFIQLNYNTLIPNTLILPSERAYKASDIKRALMRYEKVYIQSPNDRDVIKKGPYPPRQPIDYSKVWMAEDMTPEILESLWKAVDDDEYGPVRPLGKTRDYDRSFEQIYKQFLPAIRRGCLELLDPADVTVKINSESTYRHFKTLTFDKDFIAVTSAL